MECLGRKVALSWTLALAGVSVAPLFFHVPENHCTHLSGSLNAKWSHSFLALVFLDRSIKYYIRASEQCNSVQYCCTRWILIYFSFRMSLRQRRYLVKNQYSIYWWKCLLQVTILTWKFQPKNWSSRWVFDRKCQDIPCIPLVWNFRIVIFFRNADTFTA